MRTVLGAPGFTNEVQRSTNGVAIGRQYTPLVQAYNNTPCKCLGYQTPA